MSVVGRGVVCQFCGEDDFDLIGVKHHLLMGWCEPFNVLPTVQEERDAWRAAEEGRTKRRAATPGVKPAGGGSK